MPRSIRWLTFSAAVMIMAWTSGRAEGSFLYSISGTFGADTGQPTGLE